MADLPLPVPDEDTQPFWDYCKAGELRVQRCTSCNSLRFPVRPMCPTCASFEHEWQPLSGKGSIYSYTITHQVLHPALEGKTPHLAILVQLDEGIVMTSNLDDPSDISVEIGQPVEVVFDKGTDDFALPKFRKL